MGDVGLGQGKVAGVGVVQDDGAAGLGACGDGGGVTPEACGAVKIGFVGLRSGCKDREAVGEQDRGVGGVVGGGGRSGHGGRVRAGDGEQHAKDGRREGGAGPYPAGHGCERMLPLRVSWRPNRVRPGGLAMWCAGCAACGRRERKLRGGRDWCSACWPREGC